MGGSAGMEAMGELLKLLLRDWHDRWRVLTVAMIRLYVVGAN